MYNNNNIYIVFESSSMAILFNYNFQHKIKATLFSMYSSLEGFAELCMLMLKTCKSQQESEFYITPAEINLSYIHYGTLQQWKPWSSDAGPPTPPEDPTIHQALSTRILVTALPVTT